MKIICGNNAFRKNTVEIFKLPATRKKESGLSTKKIK